LGDLGSIKDKYDVAISTACPALDNIVVDTTETGQQCIEYLRKNQLGRSTFIVLDKLGEVTPKMDTPEDAPRLFDLVKAKDDKYLPGLPRLLSFFLFFFFLLTIPFFPTKNKKAFYNALRDTLVANDLEQANRIAFGKQRFRVVTLDGKLIDKSGTMSGGGNKVTKGGMSSAALIEVKPEDIQAMEKESESRVVELRQIQEQQKSLSSEYELLAQKLSICEVELTKCEMDVNSLEQQLVSFQTQEKELRQVIFLFLFPLFFIDFFFPHLSHLIRSKGNVVDEKDLQKMKSLEGDIAERKKEIEKLTKSTQALEDAIKGLQAKIMEVGGIKLKSQKSKVDGIKEAIDLANDKTTRLEVQMKRVSPRLPPS
jgi:structural maintenance of chromosome 4